jgi:hypothetical protein
VHEFWCVGDNLSDTFLFHAMPQDNELQFKSLFHLCSYPFCNALKLGKIPFVGIMSCFTFLDFVKLLAQFAGFTRQSSSNFLKTFISKHLILLASFKKLYIICKHVLDKIG